MVIAVPTPEVEDAGSIRARFFADRMRPSPAHGKFILDDTASRGRSWGVARRVAGRRSSASAQRRPGSYLHFLISRGADRGDGGRDRRARRRRTTGQAVIGHALCRSTPTLGIAVRSATGRASSIDDRRLRRPGSSERSSTAAARRARSPRPATSPVRRLLVDDTRIPAAAEVSPAGSPLLQRGRDPLVIGAAWPGPAPSPALEADGRARAAAMPKIIIARHHPAASSGRSPPTSRSGRAPEPGVLSLPEQRMRPDYEDPPGGPATTAMAAATLTRQLPAVPRSCRSDRRISV